jgi:hypothetical protein
MGGLAGHMDHPYERMDLTFNQIADALQGVLEGNISLTEKIDGQNIFFMGGQFKDVASEGDIADVQMKVSVNPDGSIRIFDVNSDPGDVKAILARNKGQASKVGMSTEELSAQFLASDKVVQDYIFGEGGSVLDATLKSMPAEVIQEVFGTYPGSYINTEIVIGDKPNILKYGKNLLVFHGLATLDTTPSPIGVERGTLEVGEATPQEGARLFDLFVKNLPKGTVKSRSGQDFKVIGPQTLNLPFTSMGNAGSDSKVTPDGTDLSAAYQECEKIIQEIRNFSNLQVGDATLGDVYGINADSRIGEYVVAFIEAKISTIPDSNLLSDQDKLILATFAADHDAKAKDARAEMGIQGTRYSAKKHGSREKLIFQLTKTADKTLTNFYKEALLPLVGMTFRFGLTLLNTTESVIADDAPKIAAVLKGMIKKAVAEVRPGLEDNVAEKFDKQLKLLKSGVDLDSMNVSIEGAVFEYPPGSGNKIKLTGAFAPLNQIINILGFDAAAKLMSAAEEDIKDNLSGASGVVSESILRKVIRKLLMSF